MANLNIILENLAKINLSDYESRIIHSLLVKTYSMNKPTALISLSQWSRSTNIKTQHIPRTIQLLQQRRIIIRSLKLNSLQSTPEYQIQEDSTLWGNANILSNKDKKLIIDRDYNTCTYCGDKISPKHVDHVIPQSRGGSNQSNNLTCACDKCNESKGNKTPEEWLNG